MILFNTQNFLPDIGGVQLYVTGLADALAARGHEIAVYCDASSRGAAAKADAARRYPVIRFGGVPLMKRPRKAHAVAKRILQGGMTAMITDTWKSLDLHRPQNLTALCVLCLAHGSEFLAKRGSGKEARMIDCMAKADVMAANSHFTAGLLKPHLRSNTCSRILRPGVAPPHGALREYTPRKKNGGPNLITIARLEPRKGIDTTLRAIAALAGKYPNLRYDIVGKGPDKRRLETLAAQFGIANRVRFHGYIAENEKAALLSTADIFLMPNRREPGSVEGFGIVFLEAAAFGVPSIAGADGGTRDAVLDGKTGLVVNAENEMNVIAALGSLLADSTRRETMGRAAHFRFWGEFAWEAAIARFETALFERGSA